MSELITFDEIVAARGVQFETVGFVAVLNFAHLLRHHN